MDLTAPETRSCREADGSATAEITTSVGSELPSPETMAIGLPPNVALITIFYQNESKKNITSATISDTLNPDLTLVPGSATWVTTSIASTTTEAGGAQTVQFSLPGGITPGFQGYVQFEVARNG